MKNIYFISILTSLLLVISIEVKAQNCSPVIDAATLVVTSDTTITAVTSSPVHYLVWLHQAFPKTF